MSCLKCAFYEVFDHREFCNVDHNPYDPDSEPKLLHNVDGCDRIVFKTPLAQIGNELDFATGCIIECASRYVKATRAIKEPCDEGGPTEEEWYTNTAIAMKLFVDLEKALENYHALKRKEMGK